MSDIHPGKRFQRLRDFALMSGAALTVMAGATISPSLPAIEAHFAGLPDVALLSRLVLTITAIFITLFAPLAGYVADRFGRKPLLILGVIGYMAAGSAGLYVDEMNTLIVSRCILGMAVACTMTSVTTLIGDYYEGEARTRIAGLQSAFMSLGGVVFLFMGGMVATLHWRAPFAIYLLPVLLLPLMIWLLWEPDRSGFEAAHAPRLDSSGQPLARSAVLQRVAFLYVIAVLVNVSFYMMPLQIPFYLRQLGAESPAIAGMATSLSPLAGMAAALAYGKYLRPLGATRIFAIAFLILGLAFLMIGEVTSVAAIFPCIALAGFGIGMMFPNLTVTLIDFTPPALRGRLVGGMTMSIFFGQFLSPFIVQPQAELWGIAGGFTHTGGALIGIAALFGMGVVWRHVR